VQGWRIVPSNSSNSESSSSSAPPTVAFEEATSFGASVAVAVGFSSPGELALVVGAALVWSGAFTAGGAGLSLSCCGVTPAVVFGDEQSIVSGGYILLSNSAK
jgi:hypothetical protein